MKLIDFVEKYVAPNSIIWLWVKDEIFKYKGVYASYSIDIDKGFIITAWVNLIGDTHKTVDMRIYNENLKII